MAERGRWGGERGREREGESEREKEKDEGGGERGSTVTFLIRALIPSWGPHPHDLAKATSPSMIMLSG